VLADTNIALRGDAFDDVGRPLSGRQLVWTSNGRTVGRGKILDVPAYRLGRRLELSARDRSGRLGRDALRLKATRVSPIFTTLTAQRLPRRSRTIRLRLASSLPGRVRITGSGIRPRRARIATRVERVRIALRGRVRQRYRLKLTLRAFGGSTRQTMAVSRGRVAIAPPSRR
jgi:hypothetical protein